MSPPLPPSSPQGSAHPRVQSAAPPVDSNTPSPNAESPSGVALVADLTEAPSYITDHYDKLNEAVIPPEANAMWNTAVRDWITLERTLSFENSVRFFIFLLVTMLIYILFSV